MLAGNAICGATLESKMPKFALRYVFVSRKNNTRVLTVDETKPQ